ncbi:MAG: hypothetical protein ABI557_01845 [Aureliella sp.]
MSVATAAIAAKRRRLIRHFQQLAAFNEQSAIAEETIPRSGFTLLDRLKDKGVIRTAPNGKLYLDQARWEETRSERRRYAFLFVIAALTASLIVWAFSTFGSGA